MKKNNVSGNILTEKLPIKHFLRIMRTTFVLFFICLFCALADPVYTQNARVTIHESNVTLKEVLSEIERQTDYLFIYSNEVNTDTKVSISARQKAVSEVLEQILSKKNMNYSMEGNHIILSIRKNNKMDHALIMDVNQQPQKKKISGTVIDENGMPIIGANIVEAGTTNGAVTDVDGKFLLSVEDNAVIHISYIGYLEQSVRTSTKSKIDVILREDTRALDELVVVGYGVQKKTAITGAISTVNTEDLVNIPVSNTSNVLSGRLAGVFVNNASGAPGYAADIRIRSVNTWKGANAPLYVIDGVIADKGSFDALDISEIENITVLKDAASGAIYGARAANGVLLVTTRTGKTGKLKLEYNYSYSFEQPSKVPEYMSSADVIKYHNIAYKHVGNPPFADEEEVDYYTNKNEYIDEWYQMAYSEPILQKHSLSATGGNDLVKYFVGTAYFDQKAFIKTSTYKKFNIRTNLDITFTEDLSGTFKMFFNEGVNKRFSFQEDMWSTFDTDPFFGSLWARLLYYMPFDRPKTSDGHFTHVWVGNPLAFIESGGYNRVVDNNVDYLIGLDYKVPFIEGLTLTSKYSRNITGKTNIQYDIKPTVYEVKKLGSHGLIPTDEIIRATKTSYPSKEGLGQRNATARSYQFNMGCNYSKKISDHHVELLFNYEQSEGEDNNFYGVRENFPLLQRDQFWATSESRTDSYLGGGNYEYGRASYIARLAYNYTNTYFLTATVRRDGSMLFAPGYRWGNFPSISAGWIVSNENFFKNNLFDFFKLRATWGIAGNDAVGGWKWKESFKSNGTAYIGEASLPRVTYSGIVNANLTWEKSREINLGIDTRFLKRFLFNAEYYSRRNYDILDSRIVSLPTEFGGSMPPVNYGIVDALGVEFELGYIGNIDNFSYEIKGNLSYATNKIIEKDIPQNVRDVDNPIGRSTDYVALLVCRGIMRTPDDIDILPDGFTMYGKRPTLGALRFVDISGPENEPDGKIDDYDRQVLNGKHWLPPYSYGLSLTGNWKKLTVDLFFQGILGGVKLYDDGYGRRFMEWARPPQFWTDSWSPENPDAKYPAPVPLDYTIDHYPSTFWLCSSNYLRLQHLTLSYFLPQSWVQKIRLQNLRFMLTGSNLFTISPFKYYDPAIENMNRYPTMKTYTLGINVVF